MDDAFRSGFASALLDVLFNRLANVISSEVHTFVKVDESLKKLETSMREALHQLNKVDQFQGNDALRRRADEVTSLCYDVEDLIDEIDRKIKNQKLASWSRKPVLHAVKPVKKWLIPRKINELEKKLAEITRDLERNMDVSQTEGHISTVSSNDGLFCPKQLKLVGRDEDILFIVKKLTCVERSDSNGVSIVGMRGLGKTVLANYILNHKEVKAKFPLILRAYMDGMSFDGANMVDKLEVVHDDSMKALNDHSQNSLLDRDRWLLLIDNLSEVSTLAWRNFHTCYLMNKERKLLVTTLNPNVARMAQTHIHYLKPLSNEHCQELVAREVSLLHNGHAISAHVTNTLAKMSCGLPLVATFLGWSQAQRIKGKNHMPVEEDLQNWPTFRKEILPIIRSTFRSLEPPLKRCFVYFSLFPQGYLFKADDLILLWIGEGLVQPHDSRLDENGLNSFDGLLEQSILQALPPNDHGLIMYEMHKFTHYWAQAAGSKTYSQLCESDSSSKELNVHTRHLSLSNDHVQPYFWEEIKRLRGLRTFLPLYDHRKLSLIKELPRDLFKKVSRLRVLSLNKTEITELPDNIYRLKHLRYLDISSTPLRRLPDTLCNLSTLQILKLKTDHGIPQLPNNFCVLISLVFIDWDKGDIRTLHTKPCNIGNLLNLRTLPLFIVGDKDGYQISELKLMKHLQGSISITKLEEIRDTEKAKEAMLNSKFSLDRLELEWTSLRNDPNAGNVLEGLRPHENLQELRIMNYGFHAFPQWLIHSLPMLEKLHLKRCLCINIPPLGQLPSLKTLRLEELNKLAYLDHNFNGRPIDGMLGCFPSLELLVLCDLPELRSWTGLSRSDMIHLRKLEFMDCPNLINLPSLNSCTLLVDLRVEHCDALCSLPELPTSLQSLTIKESDLLKNRCQLGGEDWPKVDCVLKVQIDDIEVPTSVALCIHSPNPETRNYTLKGIESIRNGVKSIFSHLF